MSGGGKSKELIQELDRISELPDPLIYQILYHLPTKDVVRTSVLSTRWRTLWLWLPRLGLNYEDFSDLDAFVRFGDKFFSSDRVSCIDKVELNVDRNEGEDDTSYVTSWIDALVKRKIQHLDVECNPNPYPSHKKINHFHGMPISLYTCETLVSLRLLEVVLPDSEFVSLPCLKTLHLEGVWNPNEATFERLVSSSPVLEELVINGCLNDNVKVFRVFSRSLKKLSIEERGTGTKVVIDAPQLGFLSIESTLSESFTITNMDPNVKLVIHLGYTFGQFDSSCISSNRNRFCSFLSGVSKVRDVTIYGDIFTKDSTCSKWLPTILESFPNLKSLSLECDAEYDQDLHLEEMDENSFLYVPECLLSSLEFVDFNVPLSGFAGEMNLVRYILENSAILKKLTLHLHNYCSTKDDLVKKLLKIPRGSTKCEVVFFDWKRVERT